MKNSEMNSVDRFHKRLRDEIAAVDNDIQSHNLQVDLLTQRLKGLKRAAELFESDQAAIAELLRAGVADGSGTTREAATAPAATMQRATVSLKEMGAQKQLGRRTHVGRSKTQAGRALASRNGGLTRVGMMAAVLRRHPRRTVRELIVLLDREFRWKANESAVTGKLYTRRDKFVHTQPDRSTNRPVTWSAK